MRLRLATRFSALIVAIFALALLTNLMALFVACAGEKRLKEIATADVPSANAADEFRAALQEERLMYTVYPSADGDKAATAGRATKPRPPVRRKSRGRLVVAEKPRPPVAR